jgi:hypothetical protein
MQRAAVAQAAAAQALDDLQFNDLGLTKSSVGWLRRGRARTVPAAPADRATHARFESQICVAQAGFGAKLRDFLSGRGVMIAGLISISPHKLE